MTAWSEGSGATPRVRPLRRIRVLLVSRDRRFLRVAAFILRRKGFIVDTTPRSETALGFAERRRPDVVVMDGNGSLNEAARSLADIEKFRPSVPVVVVSEHADKPAVRGFRLLPKWSAGDRLAAEIERAYFRRGEAHELAGDAG
jgi:DNA-binding NtrC family response regulator